MFAGKLIVSRVFHSVTESRLALYTLRTLQHMRTFKHILRFSFYVISYMRTTSIETVNKREKYIHGAKFNGSTTDLSSSNF